MFDVSIPTTSRPGIGAIIRNDSADSANDKSSAKSDTRFTRTSTFGLNSNIVTTGPGLAATICPPTPKVFNFSKVISAFLLISSLSTLMRDTGGSSNNESFGIDQFSTRRGVLTGTTTLRRAGGS